MLVIIPLHKNGLKYVMNKYSFVDFNLLSYTWYLTHLLFTNPFTEIEIKPILFSFFILSQIWLSVFWIYSGLFL
jgi:hypothetical protein